eukprot:55948-Eustigmatos_ZCMA.PRE.1
MHSVQARVDQSDGPVHVVVLQHAVESTIVDCEPHATALLGTEHHWCCPRRVARTHDTMA